MCHGDQAVYEAGGLLGHHQQGAFDVVYVLVEAVPDQVVQIPRPIALPPIQHMVDRVSQEVMSTGLAHAVVDAGIDDRIVIHPEQHIGVVSNGREGAGEINGCDLVGQFPLATDLLG